MRVLPDRRKAMVNVRFSRTAFFGIFIVVAGILGTATTLPVWVGGAIALACATAVERAGQWWYTRDHP